MKINFLNSLLFIVGLFVIGLVIDKLFGEISASYAIWIFGAGYLLGDVLGCDRGEKIGENNAYEKIEGEVNMRRAEKKHNKFLTTLNGRIMASRQEGGMQEENSKKETK